MSEPIRLSIESPTSPFKAEYVEITDAIAAEIVRRGTTHVPIPRHGDGTPISEQTQAAIQRGIADSASGRVTEMDFSDHADHKPEGDDATINALMQIEFVNPHGPWKLYYENAQKVLSAIRRGEVPGIECTTYWETVADLARDEVAELRAKLDLHAGDVKSLESQLRNRQEMYDERSEAAADLGRKLDVLTRVKDGLVAGLEAERDRALAASKHWEAEKETAYAKLLKAEEERNAARAEADALRAELHATKLSVFEWHADSERLSLEVEALKARKVKLPSADASASGREGDDYLAYVDGLRSMLESCSDAIRAAGVEVEL